MTAKITNLVCLHKKVWIGKGIPPQFSWSFSSKLFLFTIFTEADGYKRSAQMCPALGHQDDIVCVTDKTPEKRVPITARLLRSAIPSHPAGDARSVTHLPFKDAA